MADKTFAFSIHLAIWLKTRPSSDGGHFRSSTGETGAGTDEPSAPSSPVQLGQFLGGGQQGREASPGRRQQQRGSKTEGCTIVLKLNQLVSGLTKTSELLSDPCINGVEL